MRSFLSYLFSVLTCISLISHSIHGYVEKQSQLVIHTKLQSLTNVDPIDSIHPKHSREVSNSVTNDTRLLALTNQPFKSPIIRGGAGGGSLPRRKRKKNTKKNALMRWPVIFASVWYVQLTVVCLFYLLTHTRYHATSMR